MNDNKSEYDFLGIDSSLMPILAESIAAMPQPVVICDATQVDLPIVYVNRSFEVVTGYELAEVVGRNPRFLYANERNQPGLEELREKLIEGTATRVRLRNYTKGKTPHWIDLSIRPIRNSQGVTTHLFAVQQDASHLIAIEEKKQHTDDYLRSILNAIPDAVVSIDMDGRVQSFSPAAEALFGYTPEEVIGQNISILLNEPDKSKQKRHVDRLQANDRENTVDKKRSVTARRRDGTVFPMTLSLAKATRDGEVCFVGFIHDESEQEQAQAQLIELQAELEQVARLSAMGETAAAIAHELNQPLTASANYLQAANLVFEKQSEGTNSNVGKLLQKAEDEVHRAGEIIKRMRDFLKKSKGSKERQDINLLIRESLELASVGYVDLRSHVELELDEDLPHVFADKVQIEQVLVNLIRNAYEAMVDTVLQELTISSTCESDGIVTVRVADTGCGLSDAAEYELFRPFNSTKKDGMGIGLSICRTIIESHGGTIEAGANLPMGSIFSFHLPISESKAVE